MIRGNLASIVTLPTLNRKVMAIKGQNLRIFVSGSCVAEALSCQISLNNSASESSTKDSTGGWAENDITEQSWQVSVDSIDASTANIKTFINMIKAMTAVTLKWEQTNGIQNRVPVTTATFCRQGNAFLTDLSLSTQNRQNSQLTLQFTGTGAISAVTRG